jgi:hypothetical protein
MMKFIYLSIIFFFSSVKMHAQEPWLQSGSWMSDLSSYGFTRASGLTNNGGEFVIWQKNGQCGTLIDGSYYAYENGGFFTSHSSGFNNLVGFNTTSDGAFNINVSNVKAAGNTVWHSGNLNRNDIDFTAKNLFINSYLATGNWQLGSSSWPGSGGFTYNGGDILFGIHSTGGQASLQIDGAFIQAEVGKTNTYAGASQFNNIVNFPGSGTWNTSGSVGIGTTTPDQKLTVKGKIHAEEVIVDLSVPVADYVFAKDYDLMSLHKVEQYVQQNSHLPDVPSAAEIKEQGLSMGEMQNKLLKKIEEQTLYIIALNKQIEQLKLQNEKLEQIEKRIKELETK